MICDECEFRYECYLNKKRPKQIYGVIHETAKMCGRCKYLENPNTAWRKTNMTGICSKHNALTHVFNICGSFEDGTSTFQDIHVILNDEVTEKLVTTRMPKFCVVSPDE